LKRQIVVIGSGFGGLALAIRLQSKGFQVKILEKNELVGGHASQMLKNGYTFDLGPSIITAPNLIKDLFNCANKKPDDYLEFIYLDPYYRIYFHDGSFIDYSGNRDKMKAQMRKFNQHDSENYDLFMEETKKLYEAVIVDGLGSTPFDLSTMIKFVPRALKLGALTPAYKFVTKFFDDPRHQFMFSFHPLFIGGNPFRAPAIYLMIPYLEKTDGVWFSRGGMYTLVSALTTLFLELGGKIQTEAPVDQIVIEEGRAIGVHTNNEFHQADAIVSNADLGYTYKNLITCNNRKKWTDKKIETMAYSMSAFLVYMGVKKQYPKLLHHTLILSERYKGLIDDIFDYHTLPKDFSMYLHVPTRTDPEMAPPGCESMYVLIPVANLSSSINWSEVKESYTDSILNFLEYDFGMTDLKKHIDVLEIFTPEDFKQKRNSSLGSPWGMEPKLTQTAYFRPHNRSEDVNHLYFVGAGTHPGGGVPGVLLTAETTESEILKDFSN